MSRRDRFDGDPPAWIGHGIALAVVIAVASAYLLAAWLDCSSGPGVALCSMVPIGTVSTVPGALYRRLRRRWLALRLLLARRAVQRCKRAQLRQAGRRIRLEATVIELEQHLPHRGARA